MDIKRYRISVGIYDSCLTVKDADDGDWVDYSDVQRLISERDEALKKLAAMESQEPVAEVFKNSSTGTGIDWAMTGEIPEGATHLYAKPVPADKPAVAVLGSEYKLMPKQFTEEMAKAFWEEYSKSRSDNLLMRCYKAMYAAAPSHSQQSAETDAERFCDSHCTWRDHHPDCPSHGSALSASPAPDDIDRLVEHAAVLSIGLRDDDTDLPTESWRSLPDHLQKAINEKTELLDFANSEFDVGN